MQNVTRYLILDKAGELFIFGYEQGEEAGVLEELIRQAKDERSHLDWFDVGVLELKLREAAEKSQQARANSSAVEQSDAAGYLSRSRTSSGVEHGELGGAPTSRSPGQPFLESVEPFLYLLE